MKKSLTVLALLLGLNLSTYAQVNLVPNASFENYTTCPDFSGQINYVNSWNNVNLVYGSFSYGTPDFYHTCSSASLATLPNNSYATVNAFDGNGVMGLVIFNYDIPDYREYMSAQLTQPLNIESSYTIKFRITGGINQNYRFNSENFGIVFSESPLTQATWSIINEVPQIEIDTILNTPQWSEYSFTYTPDKAYSYLTLGSFRHDNAIGYVNTASSSNKYSYVFIDAIEVNTNQTGVKKLTSSSNISVQYLNEKLILKNPDNEMINSIVISDITGKIVHNEAIKTSNTGTINLPNNMNSGVYFATFYSAENATSFKFAIVK